jgi:hypothetical protein
MLRVAVTLDGRWPPAMPAECGAAAAAWRAAAWRGAAWRGAAWRGAAWRGAAWRGALQGCH